MGFGGGACGWVEEEEEEVGCDRMMMMMMILMCDRMMMMMMMMMMCKLLTLGAASDCPSRATYVRSAARNKGHPAGEPGCDGGWWQGGRVEEDVMM